MKKRIIAILVAMAVEKGSYEPVQLPTPYHVEPQDPKRVFRQQLRRIAQSVADTRPRKNRRVRHRSKYRTR